ncbi:NADH:flavin oxidoreductase/NADH oxidase [Spirosoma spitsbergense]|jgi:2,4-dienoyl-CoA reductase-like NADH-dependent reductase (Old Yellow Enzyme family)|uniref:NADH:flavin oxidoreductase/NADH oxidase n=1 Tax=Spirosoma spitsbergense TaxID=431554 RepID=UPI00039B4D20|nr:NADH:flavin oxidoreductase/NADH oxidase [Spirosoma spitsbergense]
MSSLFSPLSIRTITLKNRIVVSPMCQYSSEDGFSTDWHLVHLGSRAVGGAGLIFTEATAVSAEGRITPEDLGIWKDEHIEGLQRITRFIRQNGSVPGIQLAHAGRKASHRRPWEGGNLILPTDDRGWQTVGPSALSFQGTGPEPIALTAEGIEKVLTDFQMAAQRALTAGFQVVEIHAAHGYLLHEFLSPLSNQRTDDYGGSFANRVRLLLDVVGQVQTVWPSELPLFVRISATDWTEGGWTIDDSVALAGLLKDKGVDVVDCSSGGNVATAKIPLKPGYQVPFAERIKKETGIMTAAVGLITSPEQANAILTSGQADLVLLAREFLRDPYFPLHAAQATGAATAWPVQYERARPR